MADVTVENELNIPKKYTKSSSREDRVDAIVSKTWLRQLLKTRRVPKFILHEKLSDDEASFLFKQGEHFSSEWQQITITVISREDELVIPLPRIRSGGKPGAKLSLSQILQYVSHTNYKNLWKEAYKKYYQGVLRREAGAGGGEGEGYVELMDQSHLVREIISRAYGAPIIGDGHLLQDVATPPHPNLLPATLALQTHHHFFIIHEIDPKEFTMVDCVTFSPALLSASLGRPLFILYQLLHLMRHLHDLGLVMGSINLSDIYITQDLWIQVLPRFMDNVHKRPDITDKEENKENLVAGGPKEEREVSPDLYRLTEAWILGSLSNFDYLCELNRLAGRRYGDPRSHYVLPWVTDFSSRSGANWRDLTKSKFRLNKGDRQLDLTYHLPPNTNSAQIGHHVPDVLSEITYYVYLSRVTPRSVLCKFVRPQWVPAEYPASIQRLHSWSPDECIPEFFTDPSVFKSIHSDLGDLEVPPWAGSPQEFVASHRAALESQPVSEKLHHWIDLTFGYKLSGAAAVKAKNVCLHLVDGHTNLCRSGVVQLFTSPHPHRAGPSFYLRKAPPRLHHHLKRKIGGDEDEGQSSGLEEEEPITTSSPLSRFISRSRTSLIASPLSTSTTPVECDRTQVNLPKDYNPVEALLAVESLYGFIKRGSKDSKFWLSLSNTDLYRQVLANTRAMEMQSLGCLMVELFLAKEVRVYGPCLSHERRLSVCRSLLSNDLDTLPKRVKPLTNLLLQERDSGMTELGTPPPSAHQLLQPLLAPIYFPPMFLSLYSAVQLLVSYSNELRDLHTEEDSHFSYRIAELKVKSLSEKLEDLVDSEVCIDILMPYVIEMLSSPLTDVLAAWYLFDPIARALGPKRTKGLFLEPMMRLYDRDMPREGRLLQKRIKLYHRSFLIRLIVRFGLLVFLDSFVPPVIEAVAGSSDLAHQPRSDLSDVDEGLEIDGSLPLSPLDEDSSADSEKIISETNAEPAIFQLEEELAEEANKMGPKSAISLQNLLIDNPESEDKEVEETIVLEGSWRRKSYANIKHVFPIEQNSPDMEYSKAPLRQYVEEVCEVSTESVLWLAHRLGPLLTCLRLVRGLLRVLGPAYLGPAQLTQLGYSLQGDSNSAHILHCLVSIADLFGEQVIVVQYLPHTSELASLAKRRLTSQLEAAVIAALVLLSRSIPYFTESTFNDILQDGLVKSALEPCLRLAGSRGFTFPSGFLGRRALALKVHTLLVSLLRRSSPQARILLLPTVARYFTLFSKACPQRSSEIDGEVPKPPRESDGSCDFSESNSQKLQAQQAELNEAMNPEFAYFSYAPFADFFGEAVMEQTLKNYRLVKDLCAEYLREKGNVSLNCEIDPGDTMDSCHPVGSFSNVIVVGNRIEIQDPCPKSSSPKEETVPKGSKRTESSNRHLHGNWLAYWEHELGRNPKDTCFNIKQIKLQTFVGHTNSVKHIIPLGSENSFMSASRDKTVRLWSLRSQGDGSHNCGPQWTYTGHRKSVLSLAWVERTRLTASTDSTVHLWDPFMGRTVAVVEAGKGGASGVVNCVGAPRDPSSAVFCATTDPALRSLDTRQAAFVRELKVSQGSGSLIRCLAVSPSSSWLAVGQASGHLTVLDMTMGTVLSTWRGHEAEVLQLIALDEHTLISSALDPAVSVWNISDGKLLFNLKGSAEPVHCLELTEWGELVWGTTANRLGVQTMGGGAGNSGEVICTKLKSETLRGVLTSMALLPLNRALLLGADSGIINLIC